jgi:hypothetical protein
VGLTAWALAGEVQSADCNARCKCKMLRMHTQSPDPGLEADGEAGTDSTHARLAA